LVVIVVLPWTKQSLCLSQNARQTFVILPKWLCDETKLTDLLLVYFTYCLVVVGWYGIRSNELTVKNLERAFLSVGPTKIGSLHTELDEHGRTTRFVRLLLLVQNTGKTGATIKKVYGEFSQTPPTGRPIYKRGKEYITDLTVGPGEQVALTPHPFEDSFIDDQFFWAYVEYFDIFRIKRVSRLCVEVFPSRATFQIAGSEEWRECD
jgi:hypothetical protein